jgi:hypothetical protein
MCSLLSYLRTDGVCEYNEETSGSIKTLIYINF